MNTGLARCLLRLDATARIMRRRTDTPATFSAVDRRLQVHLPHRHPAAVHPAAVHPAAVHPAALRPVVLPHRHPAVRPVVLQQRPRRRRDAQEIARGHGLLSLQHGTTRATLVLGEVASVVLLSITPAETTLRSQALESRSQPQQLTVKFTQALAYDSNRHICPAFHSSDVYYCG